MSDQIDLVPGSRPWLPSPDAKPGKIYHRHQVPLIGLAWEAGAGAEYLFVRRYTASDWLSVWMYAKVTQEDVSALDTHVASREDFRALLDRIEATGHVFYALAHAESGIIDSFENRGPGPSARHLERLLKTAVSEDPALQQDADDLNEVFAEITGCV